MRSPNPLNNHLSDEALAEKLKQGETLVLTLLMERHKKSLYRTIWRHVGNEDDAYDLLQETFVRLYQKIDLYKPEHRFKPWLFQIAVNLCRDHLRYRKLRRLFWLAPDQTLDAPSDSPSPEQQTADILDYQCVQQAIERLPAALRTAFILFAVEEHSLLECGEILDMTPKTIEMRVYRARKILNEKLKDC